jgi:hypothetical protein
MSYLAKTPCAHYYIHYNILLTSLKKGWLDPTHVSNLKLMLFDEGIRKGERT